MRSSVELDNKDVRQIIAAYLEIPVEDVIPNRYTFSVVNISQEEIQKKMKRSDDDEA